MTGAARLGLRLAGGGYVVGVGVLAGWGFFITRSPAPILIAALLTLPASVIAVPAYYMAYGFLAQVPGANPSHSSGSRSCTSDGICHSSTTGDPAAWFIATTEILGTLALVAAAACNVLAVRYLLILWRDRRGASVR